MELQLFSDSETFTKKRPTITEAQKKEFYLNVAQQIIDNKWTKYRKSIEEIVEIIKNIFDETEDAYLLSKKFDNLGFKVNKEFLEEVENWQDKYNLIIHANISNWINIHNITPKYDFKDKVIFKNDIFPYFKKNEKVEIEHLLNYNAKYLVKNMLIEWEIIDEHAELANE